MNSGRRYTAQQEAVTGRLGAIRFYPDGSATGGHLTLARMAGGDNVAATTGPAIRVSVDWLTGRVDVED
ncbi:MAG: hypothetical protein WD767_10745 [Alphaproteobacteria bacterium]